VVASPQGFLLFVGSMTDCSLSRALDKMSQIMTRLSFCQRIPIISPQPTPTSQSTVSCQPTRTAALVGHCFPEVQPAHPATALHTPDSAQMLWLWGCRNCNAMPLCVLPQCGSTCSPAAPPYYCSTLNGICGPSSAPRQSNCAPSDTCQPLPYQCGIGLPLYSDR